MIDKNRKKTLTIISLGVGVQSSTMALMSAKGILPKVQGAIFADTKNEPKAIELYLEFLKKTLPFPVYQVSKSNIYNDFINNIEKGIRSPNPPLFTQNKITGKKGMLLRQCTQDYKIAQIKKKIRELCNVGYKKRFPKDKYVEQWIGISTDEIQRMKPSRDKYILNRFPLIEMKMSRQDCLDWMKDHKIPLPEKSACIICPYHNDNYWHFMKTERLSEFEQAVVFDRKIRKGSAKIKDNLYLHRSCKPLEEIEFNKKETDKQLDMFNNDCSGLCGV